MILFFVPLAHVARVGVERSFPLKNCGYGNIQSIRFGTHYYYPEELDAGRYERLRGYPHRALSSDADDIHPRG